MNSCKDNFLISIIPKSFCLINYWNQIPWCNISSCIRNQTIWAIHIATVLDFYISTSHITLIWNFQIFNSFSYWKFFNIFHFFIIFNEIFAKVNHFFFISRTQNYINAINFFYFISLYLWIATNNCNYCIFVFFSSFWNSLSGFSIANICYCASIYNINISIFFFFFKSSFFK